MFCELSCACLNHRSDNANDDEEGEDSNKSPCKGTITTLIFDFLQVLIHVDSADG
jgi:hypothetical protein